MVYNLLCKLKKAAYKIIVEPDIKHSLGECGKNTHIENGSNFYPLSNIYIGSNASIGPYGLFWTSRARIIVHDYVLIGPRVTIITGDHRKDVIGKHIIEISDAEKNAEDDQDVVIEEGAWIGANVTILKGVTIGEDSIVAAGSVVTKDVAPYSIVGGNPAKELRKRFSKEELELHIEKIKARR